MRCLYHTMSTLPFFLLLLLLFGFSAAPGPASVPLHDIIGKNLTSSNLYYIRNYTVGSYSGAGFALYTCGRYVGFTSSDSDTGLPVRLTSSKPNATVIYPGDHFKITLGAQPPCARSPELGVEGSYVEGYVVTRGSGASESYFSVAIDDFGRYSLRACGSCAKCRNLCFAVGNGPYLGDWFNTGPDATPFNFFFQKVRATFDPLESQ